MLKKFSELLSRRRWMIKKEFTDVDFEMFVMPFGTHATKGFDEIPASYLLWLCDEDYCPPVVRAYVELNEEELLDRSADEYEESKGYY